ncbi:hypothetical protein AB0F17_65725 [Nonomuraea sp. NPDC026600]|uniref:hypothetical protein n=1 Tax=Nonomuraea sp. NPDC026600 TaxID=3155363 RepID=UPI0033F03385
MPTRLWWRTVQLLQARGAWLHPCALRMARHLAYCADGRGRLVDVPELLARYSAHHGRGHRTAWTDFMRLVDVGLVRQVCAAAPYRQARYILCMDLAALPDDLPRDLAAALAGHVDDPTAIVRGTPTRADVHRALADCEVIRVGSATRPKPIMVCRGAGKLHTSPFTREGSPPSSPPPPSHRPQRARGWPFQGQDLGEEGGALYFVKSLGPDWASQRQGVVPAAAELAEIAELARLLLQHMPESEVREVLTSQVGSAADLVGVLRWRTGRTLAGLRRSERRARRLRVDDDGARHTEWLASNAERDAQEVAPRRAELVALARQRAREVAEARRAQEQARLSARIYG